MSSSLPAGLVYYRHLREFMATHGLDNKTFDNLINLDKMIASASVRGGKGIVRISDRTYTIDYNQATPINAMLNTINHIMVDDDGDSYAEIVALYQAILMKGNKISHGYFKEFIITCNQMPCRMSKYPTKPTQYIESGAAPKMMANFGKMTELAEEYGRLMAKNKSLIEKCIVQKLDATNMYCHKVSFDTTESMKGYSFNGHYLTEKMYDALLDDGLGRVDRQIDVYIITSHLIDEMPYTVGHFTRKYDAEIERFTSRRGCRYHIIKLSDDCYVSTVSIAWLSNDYPGMTTTVVQ